MEYAFILLFLYASYLSIEKYVHTGNILKWRGGQRPASALPVKENRRNHGRKRLRKLSSAEAGTGYGNPRLWTRNTR